MVVATFGGSIAGVWSVPAFNLLIFNDGGLAFSALGPEGWCWTTPRISWDGFEAIEIAEKTIYGRAWNAVEQQWQIFSIEIVTGIVRGGAYFEAGQQRIAVARELVLRGAAPLHPLVRRVAEGTVGLLGLVLVLLTVYLVIGKGSRDSGLIGTATYSLGRGQCR